MEFGAFALLRPWWLLALPVIAIAWRVTRGGEAGLGDWPRVVDAPLLAAMLKRQGDDARPPKERAAFLALALVTLALSGPAVARREANQFRNLDATLVLLDVSNASLSPQTVAAAQALLAQSGARQMGLALYAGDAYLASPLTNDVAALNALLFAIDDHTVPESGARPDRALALARRILREAHIVGADVALISTGAGVDPASAHEAARLASQGHALHTLFVGAGASDAAARRAALAGLAAEGRGRTMDAARAEEIASQISGRAIGRIAGSALQTLGWRDYGQLLLICAAAPLLLRFRRSAP